MQRWNCLSKISYAMVCSLAVSLMLSITAVGQRRWVAVRPQTRSRIVVYQPRPYVVYQPRPSYTYRTYMYSYPQPYYSNQYYSYSYPQPYYTNQYSYRYSQPYFANPYTYSWANPTYSYDGYRYRPRHRHARYHVGIWSR